MDPVWLWSGLSFQAPASESTSGWLRRKGLRCTGPARKTRLALPRSCRTHVSTRFSLTPCCVLWTNVPFCAGIDVNATDATGRTPLHWSASSSHETCTALLLDDARVDANARCSQTGYTALHDACVAGSVPCVAALLARPSVQVNAVDLKSRSALFLAAVRGNDAVVQILLSDPDVDVAAANDVGVTALHAAALAGKVDVVRTLLRDPRVAVDVRSAVGVTPLFVAADYGHVDVVQALLQDGRADPNAQTNRLVPLHQAAVMKKAAVVAALLRDPRVDPNPVSGNGGTPLFAAAQVGDVPVLQVLLADSRTAVNHRAKENMTALHVAAMHGRAAAVAVLLADARIETELINDGGATALGVALENDMTDAVRAFLSDPRIGVDAVGKIREGSSGEFRPATALYAAVEFGSIPTIKAVLECPRIDVNASWEGGVTALVHAAGLDRGDALSLILEDPRVLDLGHALLMATGRGNLGALRALLAHPSANPSTVREEESLSALHVAAMFNQAQAVTVLLADARECSALGPGLLCVYSWRPRCSSIEHFTATRDPCRHRSQRI